jgi:hypothetical protein
MIEIGIVTVVTVSQTRICRTWIVDRPTVVVSIFQVVTNVTRFCLPNVLKTSQCSLEQHRQIELFVAKVNRRTAGELRTVVFSERILYHRCDFAVTVDILELHVTRAKDPVMGL